MARVDIKNDRIWRLCKNSTEEIMYPPDANTETSISFDESTNAEWIARILADEVKVEHGKLIWQGKELLFNPDSPEPAAKKRIQALREKLLAGGTFTPAESREFGLFVLDNILSRR